MHDACIHVRKVIRAEWHGYQLLLCHDDEVDVVGYLTVKRGLCSLPGCLPSHSCWALRFFFHLSFPASPPSSFTSNWWWPCVCDSLWLILSLPSLLTQSAQCDVSAWPAHHRPNRIPHYVPRTRQLTLSHNRGLCLTMNVSYWGTAHNFWERIPLWKRQSSQ